MNESSAFSDALPIWIYFPKPSPLTQGTDGYCKLVSQFYFNSKNDQSSKLIKVAVSHWTWKINYERVLWGTAHVRNFLWCEGTLAFEQAHKAFFHSGVYCDICKMKKFDDKKLFVTQACLHVLHCMYLYMSSLCYSQKRQDHFVWSKVMYRLSEILEPAGSKWIINIFIIG